MTDADLTLRDEVAGVLTGDPLAIECPFCHAAPSQPCRKKVTGRATVTHQARTGCTPTKAHRYMPLEERLFLLVDKTATCWQWLGWTTTDGYGLIRHKGRRLLVHRVSYELANGPITSGAVLDHLCRNRSCVNPDHLEPVTVWVNMIRGDGPAAENARKTHCANGHEFTPENTSYSKGGRHRTCRTCKRETAKRRYLRAALAEPQQPRPAPETGLERPNAPSGVSVDPDDDGRAL